MKKTIFAILFLVLSCNIALCDGLHRVSGIVTDLSDDGKTITIENKGLKTDVNFLQNTVKFQKELEKSLRKGVFITIILKEGHTPYSQWSGSSKFMSIETIELEH